MKHILIVLSILFGWSTFSMAQCYPDRHNTNWFDGWISCEAAENPNQAYESSHWILYDLGEVYKLGQMHVWNSNDPAHLDYGMSEVSIDYSLDGVDWINLGDFNFEMGTGKSIYEGFDGPSFESASARYVLLTAISNFGGDCYGLSEIRIEVEQSSVNTEEVQFEVRCASTNEGVLLEWTVNGSLDGVTYIIERSDDANDWLKIKETESFTLEEGVHTFHYIDNGNTDQSSFYRLISRLANGQESSSQSHFCTNKKLEARVYPNPMGSNAKLEIMTQSMDLLSVRISDLYGRLIYDDAFIPNSISTSISLDELIIPKGQYIISVRQGISGKDLKLVKIGE